MLTHEWRTRDKDTPTFKPHLQHVYACRTYTPTHKHPLLTPTQQELEREFAWLCDHFYVIAAGEDKMPTIDWVLEKARAAVIQ